MENSSGILRSACLVVLLLGSCAFAYSLGWQHGEAAGNQNTMMRVESIAASARATQLDWTEDDAETGAGEACGVRGASAATPTGPQAAAEVGGN
jgi:hypothetical protein